MTPRLSTEYIAVHCSATKVTQPIDEDDLRAWHLARGWNDIGYNVVITLDAVVQIGRPIDARGAHVAGYNSRSVGVCLIGGLDSRGKPAATYSPQQYDALETTLRFLRLYAPDAKIRGHRDFPNVAKACPCFDVQSWCENRGIDPRRD